MEFLGTIFVALFLMASLVIYSTASWFETNIFHKAIVVIQGISHLKNSGFHLLGVPPLINFPASLNFFTTRPFSLITGSPKRDKKTDFASSSILARACFLRVMRDWILSSFSAMACWVASGGRGILSGFKYLKFLLYQSFPQSLTCLRKK
jgi:hypothetical protein